MTVERLENEMSAIELDEWIEFYSLEPFGNEEKMSDKRNSLMCAITANSRVSGGDHKPDDFRFYPDQYESVEVEEMNEEQIKAAQSAIFQIFTAK